MGYRVGVGPDELQVCAVLVGVGIGPRAIAGQRSRIIRDHWIRCRQRVAADILHNWQCRRCGGISQTLHCTGCGYRRTLLRRRRTVFYRVGEGPIQAIPRTVHVGVRVGHRTLATSDVLFPDIGWVLQLGAAGVLRRRHHARCQLMRCFNLRQALHRLVICAARYRDGRIDIYRDGLCRRTKVAALVRYCVGTDYALRAGARHGRIRRSNRQIRISGTIVRNGQSIGCQIVYRVRCSRHVRLTATRHSDRCEGTRNRWCHRIHRCERHIRSIRHTSVGVCHRQAYSVSLAGLIGRERIACVAT